MSLNNCSCVIIDAYVLCFFCILVQKEIMRTEPKIFGLSFFAWMSIAIGLVYIWFGALKFFPEMSPAEELASETISILTFGILEGRLALFILAIWEFLVGITFLLNYHKKWNVGLAIAHMIGTFLPYILLFGLCFKEQPLQFTIVGQYIFKNILFLVVMLFFWHRLNHTYE